MKTKMFIYVVTMIVLLSFLTGCSGKDSEEKRSFINDNKNDEMVIRNSFVSYNNRGACYISDGYAKYQEAGTGKKIALCTKPNCTHGEKGNWQTEICDAYLGANPGFLIMNNTNLFFITCPTDTTQSFFFDRVLYKSDLDGKNRKQVALLKDVENVNVGAYENNWLALAYIVSDERENVGKPDSEELDKRISGVYLINTENGEKRHIRELQEFSANCYQVYIYDGILYYTFLYYKEFLDYSQYQPKDYYERLKDVVVQEMWAYDIASGNEKMVWQGSDEFIETPCNGYIMIHNDIETIFLYKGEEVARYQNEKLAEHTPAFINKYVYEGKVYMTDETKVWNMDIETGKIENVAEGKLDDLKINRIEAIMDETVYFTVMDNEKGGAVGMEMKWIDFLNGEKDKAIKNNWLD